MVDPTALRAVVEELLQLGEVVPRAGEAAKKLEEILGAAPPLASLPPLPVRLEKAAELLGFPSAQDLRAWLRRRKIPYYRDQKIIFVDLAEVDRYIRGCHRREAASPRSTEATAVKDAVASLTRK